MTYPQGAAFGLIVTTLGLFVWGRLRYDVVALTSLMAGVLLGVVPAGDAFDGFKNDVVVIIAAALVVSAAFARSGLAEVTLAPLLARLKSEQALVPALAASVALLSMATKNVGALAVLIPVAQQQARRTGVAPSRLLMPMSYAALLGGLVTLVGTSPNIIVAAVRQHALGRPFGMYDFAPVGLSLTAIGLVFLAVAYRLLPKARRAHAPLTQTLSSNIFTTEARAPKDWNGAQRRVGEIKAASAAQVDVVALVRGQKRRQNPHANTQVQPGDVLVLQGDEPALHRLMADCRLEPHPVDPPRERREGAEEVRAIEAVVGTQSSLIGARPRQLDLRGKHNVQLLAVARAGRRLTERLDAAPIRAGDVLLLRGGESNLPRALAELGALPLADRLVRLGSRRALVLPAVVVAAAMIAIALKLLPVAIAFALAALALVLLRVLPMREAYAALDGPVLVLIAALIPLSDALQRTGAAGQMASGLAAVFLDWPPLAILAALTTVSMLSAPFFHNAPTVLVLAPVAVDVARRLGISPDPLLMGVAVGAACDFLTPVGHQCNTLVLAPGGYRFSDYARLGAPLSLAVIVFGTVLIAFFWPLRPG